VGRSSATVRTYFSCTVDDYCRIYRQNVTKRTSLSTLITMMNAGTESGSIVLGGGGNWGRGEVQLGETKHTREKYVDTTIRSTIDEHLTHRSRRTSCTTRVRFTGTVTSHRLPVDVARETREIYTKSSRYRDTNDQSDESETTDATAPDDTSSRRECVDVTIQ